ncbi:hypothetical protein [Sphingomonas sp. M1-B02]|uniref:hypothetical protein n=1 Tax=Sphingomonas sp. M1-B02 TaxID=3114300 RepID=UPI00223FF1ED|nr:hypothetical protein [Sphingomonas sp. S6-11]UZK65980.1 hypothetical protein OKW87_15950 [Sphingomonas sp. S6-11]
MKLQRGEPGDRRRLRADEERAEQVRCNPRADEQSDTGDHPGDVGERRRLNRPAAATPRCPEQKDREGKQENSRFLEQGRRKTGEGGDEAAGGQQQQAHRRAGGGIHEQYDAKRYITGHGAFSLD